MLKHIDVAIHPDIFKTVTSAVADVGFPRIGGANSPGGEGGVGVRQHMILPKFPQKTTWNWKNLDSQGGTCPSRPLDPPMICNFVISFDSLCYHLYCNEGRYYPCRNICLEKETERVLLRQKANMLTVLNKHSGVWLQMIIAGRDTVLN